MRARARYTGLICFGVVLVAAALWVVSFPLQWWNPSARAIETRYLRAGSRFIDVAGTRIHYQDEGRRDGLVVVLLHNDHGNLRVFDAWIPLLKERYRIVRLDLPGYGLTGEVADHDYSLEHDGRIIDELTTRLGITRFALIATSLPASSAFRYAALHPERVTALVLANAGGLPRLPNQRLNIPDPNWLRRWAYQYYTPRSVFALGVARAFHDDALIPPGFVDQVYLFTNRKERFRESRLRFALYHSDDAQAVLAKVTAPVLLLWGRYSELDPSEADRFAAWMNAARSVDKIVYEDVGHALFVEAGVRAAQDVDRFVTRVTDRDQ